MLAVPFPWLVTCMVLRRPKEWIRGDTSVDQVHDMWVTPRCDTCSLEVRTNWGDWWKGDFLRPSLNSQEASWIHTLPVTHRMIFSLDITTFFFESLHLSIHFRYLQIVHACPCPSEWNTHWTVKLLFAFAAQLHDVILFRQVGPSVCWDGRRTSEKKQAVFPVTRQVSFVWGLIRALSWWP